MPAIVSIEMAFPKYQYKQEEITSALGTLWSTRIKNLNRLSSIQKNVLVETRNLSMPLENYPKGLSFKERNDHFIQTSTDLATSAIERLLNRHDLSPEKIQSLWSNTVTGFAIPSLEARVMNRLPFLTTTKRVPLMGLGCMAGVAGINRVGDYLKGHPKEAALFFSAECCSLTFQFEDISVANLVSTGLFGDGAAAVLMVGDQHPLAENAPLKLLTSESIFFSDTEDVMGWDVSGNGLKIILNRNVPDVVREKLVPPLERFLEKQNLKVEEIASFFAHPGGPKVLNAMEEVLKLQEGGLSHSWESLRENGNMSSVSVLDILSRHLNKYEQSDRKLQNKLGLSLAMGPAFSAEIGLMQWN